MAEPAWCLVRLWQLVNAEGVDLRCEIRRPEFGRDDGRFYWPKPNLGHPARIRIFRDPPIPTGPVHSRDPTADLVTLAHECGHCLSDKRGFWTDRQRKAREKLENGFRLTVQEGALIVKEEKRAWKVAGRILRALGCDHWQSVATVASAAALATYRRRVAELARPLVVYFDQNCMNARQADRELNRLDELAIAGRIELVRNPRNRFEVPPGGRTWNRLARERLKRLRETPEVARMGASPMGDAVMGCGMETDVPRLFDLIFPDRTQEQIAAGRTSLEPGQNDVHDVLHLANAEDAGGDVFLTRDGELLAARDKLGLRVRVVTPAELLAEFEDDG